MANPTLSSCKPQAILPVQAIIFANVSDPPERASSQEVMQRLRGEVHLIQPKEKEQTLVYANTKGHQHFDLLSVLRKEVEESRKEREKSDKEREESRKEREKSDKEREESRKERADHKTVLDHHEQQFQEYRTIVEDLTAEVRDLTKTSKGYLDIRTRFLDVYQRHRGNLNEQQRKDIKKGNWRAHSGDAEVDAKLYREAGRSDSGVFQELYGVRFEQVLKFADEVNNETVDARVFHVLDIRGTQMARGKRFPPELENAFTSYLSEVYKESEDKASYNSSEQVHPYESVKKVAARARTFWTLYRQSQHPTQGVES